MFFMQVLQYKGGFFLKWTMFFTPLATCKYIYFWELLCKMFIKIITINELDKSNILVLIFNVRFWILNYHIFILIKKIPKIQRKMNHCSLKLQHFLINCTRYEVQWCPLHRIKLNPKIFLISIVMDMFLKYLNFSWKI